MKSKTKVLGEYLGHLMVGAMMFAALLLFGGMLNALVHWAGPFIGDPSFAELMQLTEKVILYADIAFLTWWALFSTYRAIKEMMANE